MGTGLRYLSLLTEHSPRQTPRARQPGVSHSPDAGRQLPEESVITMTESQQQSSAAPPVEPTTPPTATPLTATPLTQLQTDAAIGDLRVEIDAVDAALVDLVARRIQISKQVGRLRMAAGGTRLSLSREQAVVARFSAELGETGTSLAMLLLRAGRGRL